MMRSIPIRWRHDGLAHFIGAVVGLARRGSDRSGGRVAALRLAGLVAAAGFLAALSYGKGRAEGKAIIEAEQSRARLDAIKRRNEVGDEINSLGAQEVDERLKRWNRVED